LKCCQLVYHGVRASQDEGRQLARTVEQGLATATEATEATGLSAKPADRGTPGSRLPFSSTLALWHFAKKSRSLHSTTRHGATPVG
jgi:hypothetical protein